MIIANMIKHGMIICKAGNFHYTVEEFKDFALQECATVLKILNLFY